MMSLPFLSAKLPLDISAVVKLTATSRARYGKIQFPSPATVRRHVFDEKFPVRNSLEQQVFTLGMHLICVSSGSYLQATEVSTYSSLLTL